MNTETLRLIEQAHQRFGHFGELKLYEDDASPMTLLCDLAGLVCEMKRSITVSESEGPQAERDAEAELSKANAKIERLQNSLRRAKGYLKLMCDHDEDQCEASHDVEHPICLRHGGPWPCWHANVAKFLTVHLADGGE